MPGQTLSTASQHLLSHVEGMLSGVETMPGQTLSTASQHFKNQGNVVKMLTQSLNKFKLVSTHVTTSLNIVERGVKRPQHRLSKNVESEGSGNEPDTKHHNTSSFLQFEALRGGNGCHQCSYQQRIFDTLADKLSQIDLYTVKLCIRNRKPGKGFKNCQY